MKTTTLANYLGLTVEETKEFLENKYGYRVGKSNFTTILVLHPDGTESPKEVLDLVSPSNERYTPDRHRYFDENQREYYKDEYSEFYVREDESIKISVALPLGSYGYSARTSQASIDKLGVKKCSVCGKYEAYNTMFKSHESFLQIREFEGQYYCPSHDPEGTIRCHECGKIVRKEEATEIYDNWSFPEYYDCPDCVKELENEEVLAKCVDGNYHTKFALYWGQHYPYDVYRALKFNTELPYWWEKLMKEKNG